MLPFKRNFHKGNKGFTLVEMVISVAFLAVISIFMVQLFISANNLRIKAYDLDKSVTVSKQLIETIKACKSPEELKNCRFAESGVIKEAGGKVEITVYYDEAWKLLEKPDSETQKKAAFIASSAIKAEKADKAGSISGICSIDVKIMKTGQYTLEKKKENEIYSVNAVKYFAVR